MAVPGKVFIIKYASKNCIIEENEDVGCGMRNEDVDGIKVYRHELKMAINLLFSWLFIYYLCCLHSVLLLQYYILFLNQVNKLSKCLS